ncbi:MAG: DMT family transporter [Candidatus Promineifilaceae bacterium]
MTATAQSTPHRPFLAYAALAVTLFAASYGPIVIREAQGVGLPSVLIIAARLWLSALLLTPYVWRTSRGDFGRITRRHWGILLTAGFLFALNLLALFFALEYTTVLMTGIMRRTGSLWMILLEIGFLGVAFSRRVWVGLLLAVAGSVLVALASSLTASNQVDFGSAPIIGATIAASGALAMSLYMLVGRAMRNVLSTLAYSWLIFIVAAVFTTLLTLYLGIPLSGYTRDAVYWIVVVTLVTQILGHIPINYALHYFPATYVSLIMQGAVVLMAIFAFVAFQEVPTTPEIIGSIIIAAGIFVATYQPAKKTKSNK